MRVVHLLRKYNPAEWGGTETAIQRLFDGFREQQVESVVYAPRLKTEHGTRNTETIEDPLERAGCEVKRFNAFVPIIGISEQRKRQLVSVGGNLMSFDLIPSLWNERASVIHTHTLGRIGGIAMTIARKRELPFVITIHGGVLDLPVQMKKDFNTPVGGLEWGRLFGLLFQSHRLFPEADAILTCNVNEARLLSEKFPEKRIVVQPHGVPLAPYQKDQRESALIAFPQIRGKRVLLSIGRIDPVKNQDWVIDQCPEIFRKHPDALLVLAGACTDEVYGDLIRKKIESLGLQNRVLLTGGLPPNDPRLIGLLQLAEVLVLPSKSETFGLVVLEAWSTGTLVVSSRTSGACALVRDGENGWLFDLENPQTFHVALDAALAKSETTQRVLRSGGDAVNTQYNVVALAGKMKRLYEELIEEKNALRNPSRRRHECVDTR